MQMAEVVGNLHWYRLSPYFRQAGTESEIMKRSSILARTLLSRFAAREAELQRMIASERESMNNNPAMEPIREPADQADLAFETAWLTHKGHMIEHYLKEIDAIAAARERVDNGTFGICIECGETIDPRRLGVAITAVRCAECQRSHEYRRALRH
jgi:DnaK suppressor protein